MHRSLNAAWYQKKIRSSSNVRQQKKLKKVLRHKNTHDCVELIDADDDDDGVGLRRKYSSWSLVRVRHNVPVARLASRGCSI